MLSPTTITNGWLSFLAGLITSPHCILMCGPLAILLYSKNAPQRSNLSIQLTYHLARILSFTLTGTLAGAFGLLVLSFFALSTVKIFPFIVATFLIAYALGAERLFPRIPFANTIYSKIAPILYKQPKPLHALLLGLLTPLLPCGPLYTVFWIAILSGSPTLGAEISLGFALGTVPLFLLSIMNLHKLKFLIHKKYIHYLQKIIAFLAALFLIYRTLSYSGPISLDFCC